MELFQGGREGERQMNRQIITNAIINCYSSNLIVTQKKGMRQGVRECGGGMLRLAEEQRWAEPSGVQRQHGREQQEQMLGLQFLWQHTKANATSVPTWQR